MIKCFLIPMTEPPYSRENPQRPKYINEIGGLSWSGVPMFESKTYVVKVSGDVLKLNELQSKVGVIDFPNIDSDELENLPVARKAKDVEIKKILKIKDKPNEKVKDFINRTANSEVQHNWDKDLVFSGE